WMGTGQLTPVQESEAVTLFLASLNGRFPDLVVEDAPRRAVLERWLPHVRRDLESQSERELRYVYCAFLRKAGRVDEALALIRREHTLAPSYLSAVALSMALKAKGDTEGWRSACVEATRHPHPTDAGVRLDLGDYAWEVRGKLDEAE